jgi:hypothetical protein
MRTHKQRSALPNTSVALLWKGHALAHAECLCRASVTSTGTDAHIFEPA